MVCKSCANRGQLPGVTFQPKNLLRQVPQQQITTVKKAAQLTDKTHRFQVHTNAPAARNAGQSRTLNRLTHVQPARPPRSATFKNTALRLPTGANGNHTGRCKTCQVPAYRHVGKDHLFR